MTEDLWRRVAAGEVLRWRRRVVLRGPMPIEIRCGQDVLGRLTPLNALGTRYRAESPSGAWVFSRSIRQRWCAAHHEASESPVAKAARAGFRRKRVELASGTALEWRQRGWAGHRYELGWPDGSILMTARNTGGPLRWNGHVRLESPVDLGEGAAFLVLFGVFLVHNSSEVHF